MELLQLFTTAETAKSMSLTEQTVLRLARSGKLQGVKIGNRWRFSYFAVKNFLAVQAYGSAE